MAILLKYMFYWEVSAMNAMERVKTKQAAAELNIGVDSLQFLMQMEKMPIGYAYKKPGCKRYSYIIYRGLLDQYKMQLAAGTARIGIWIEEKREKEAGKRTNV